MLVSDWERRLAIRLGNRSGNGSRGGSDCGSRRNLGRESDREIDGVSGCDWRTEFHGDLDVEVQSDW